MVEQREEEEVKQPDGQLVCVNKGMGTEMKKKNLRLR